MTASLNNVITATLLPEGRSLARDNMNVVAVMTSQLGKLSTANRYETYAGIEQVGTDFGTSSDVYQHATAFFGTTPNAVNASGLFVVGFWRGADEDTVATAGVLTGAQVNEVDLIGELQKVSDGSFNITVDGGTEQNITAIDFRTVIDTDDVLALLNTEITGATVTYENLSFVITSDTTGASSEVTLLSSNGTGTFVGEVLNLATGTGAVTVDGVDSGTLTDETKVEAVTALKSLVNFKGFVFVDKPLGAEAKALAQWCQANSVLSYDVFDQPSNLEIDVTNPVWDIKLSGLSNYRCLYSKLGNRRFATAYMARNHTVNFNAENSALTMNLKELPVSAEAYTQTEITKAQNVGLDIYTTFKRVPKILTSGANDFVDNRYNLIAFIDAVQTDMFNLLGTTSTKIPQTRRGVNQIVDQAEKTTRGFVRAGVFGAGGWSSPDSFGEIDTFKRNIREFGFYWLAGSLADQVQSERVARKSPVLQGAVKNQGAVHKVDIVINFNL